VPLPLFPVAVGPYLPRRLEAIFANFWIRYIFLKNHENINIFFLKFLGREEERARLVG
jgi:hypothetical protein